MEVLLKEISGVQLTLEVRHVRNRRDTFQVPSASVQQACCVLRRLHAVKGWHDLHISCRALPHTCQLQVAGLIASQLPHPCRLQVLAARCADVPAPWLACQLQLCALQA